MDIQREGAARKRLIRNVVIGVAVTAVVVAISIVVSRLKPAAPTVERATVWTDTVKRGPMVREVSGLGSLVPEQILWIPATTGGRVERINVLPGALVQGGHRAVGAEQSRAAALGARRRIRREKRGGESEGPRSPARKRAFDPAIHAVKRPVRLPTGAAKGCPGHRPQQGGAARRSQPQALALERSGHGQPQEDRREAHGHTVGFDYRRKWRCNAGSWTSCGPWPH